MVQHGAPHGLAVSWFEVRGEFRALRLIWTSRTTLKIAQRRIFYPNQRSRRSGWPCAVLSDFSAYGGYLAGEFIAMDARRSFPFKEMSENIFNGEYYYSDYSYIE